MVTISLIPILGLIFLIAVALGALSWRGSSLSRATQSVDEAASNILHKDLENDQQLVVNLLSGTPIDECFSQHADVRRRLLPTNGEGNWTVDDLHLWKKARRHHESETINRRMMFPTFGIVLAIISVCVVSVVLLYEFQLSAPQPVDDLATDFNAIPAQTTLDESGNPLVETNVLPDVTGSNPSHNPPSTVIQPNRPAVGNEKVETDSSSVNAAPNDDPPNPNQKETATKVLK